MMNPRMTTVAVGTAAAGCLALAAMGDIVGSAHDFSGTDWAGGEICKPCHAPHFSEMNGFLWAHTLSDQVYTLFDGTTSSPGGEDELDQYSRMCLSCHDGTIALNDFHNGAGSPQYISEANNVGGDGILSDDHPIGVTAEYPIQGNEVLHVPVETPSGLWGFGGTYTPEVPLYEFRGDQVVSCASCHTPHARAGVPKLLRKNNAASDLCLTCHIR